MMKQTCHVSVASESAATTKEEIDSCVAVGRTPWDGHLGAFTEDSAG